MICVIMFKDKYGNRKYLAKNSLPHAKEKYTICDSLMGRIILMLVKMMNI